MAENVAALTFDSQNWSGTTGSILNRRLHGLGATSVKKSMRSRPLLSAVVLVGGRG